MFPSLGLFKRVPCPTLPHCDHPSRCIYSHATTSTPTSRKREAPSTKPAPKRLRQPSHTTKPTSPTIIADLSAHTGVKLRQTITDKLFEQYLRIYPPERHGPEKARGETRTKERQLLGASSSPAGYKQQALSALMQLKKQNPAIPSDDDSE
ncbi:hypothetical protein DM01DRAFT_1408746, partial [Hesseltinella vesiculosa]